MRVDHAPPAHDSRGLQHTGRPDSAERGRASTDASRVSTSSAVRQENPPESPGSGLGVVISGSGRLLAGVEQLGRLERAELRDFFKDLRDAVREGGPDIDAFVAQAPDVLTVIAEQLDTDLRSLVERRVERLDAVITPGTPAAPPVALGVAAFPQPLDEAVALGIVDLGDIVELVASRRPDPDAGPE